MLNLSNFISRTWNSITGIAIVSIVGIANKPGTFICSLQDIPTLFIWKLIYFGLTTYLVTIEQALKSLNHFSQIYFLQWTTRQISLSWSQFYIQLVYKTPLSFTLRTMIWAERKINFYHFLVRMQQNLRINTYFFALKNLKKTPSKVAQKFSFFLPYCPNGPNKRIDVPKCGL